VADELLDVARRLRRDDVSHRIDHAPNPIGPGRQVRHGSDQ
jgi:hypothetical protein